ncbi:hypothetical protein U9M48_010214 [Paspalum notatum var. saurae]|uniref:DUF3615 domain-containing protein n=1 Tax=Paspalum notatum var. saurae TaxID=547442 RepID=A0AAQ3SSU7_PASNO
MDFSSITDSRHEMSSETFIIMHEVFGRCKEAYPAAAAVDQGQNLAQVFLDLEGLEPKFVSGRVFYIQVVPGALDLEGQYRKAEEHPSSMVNSSELGWTDMPRFEELSLSDPPLSTPQTADEMTDETDDDELPPEPVGFGFRILGPQTLRYIPRPPRPKWLGGVRGQAMLDEHGNDGNSGKLSPMVTDSSRSEALPVTQMTEKSTGDPDDDTEEELRLLEEYFVANPPVSMEEAFDKLKAAQHALLTARAAEQGTEPPPPPRRQFLVDQARQEASAAASNLQHSSLHRKSRSSCEASTEEIVENAKKWMRDEVMVVFQNYIGRRDDLKILDYQLDELCHQCVNVENYNKIFHHYNFTVKLKEADSDDWVVVLYFAEVKQTFGRKSYFCCALEANEDGLCYACQNQGVGDLKHPATGGFDMGWPGIGYDLWYTDE